MRAGQTASPLELSVAGRVARWRTRRSPAAPPPCSMRPPNAFSLAAPNLAGEAVAQHERATRTSRSRSSRRPGARAQPAWARSSTTSRARRVTRATAAAARRCPGEQISSLLFRSSVAAVARTAGPTPVPGLRRPAAASRRPRLRPRGAGGHQLRRDPGHVRRRHAVPAAGAQLHVHGLSTPRSRPACSSRPGSRPSCSGSACSRRCPDGQSARAGGPDATAIATASPGGSTASGTRCAGEPTSAASDGRRTRRTCSSRRPAPTTATWASPPRSSRRSRARGRPGCERHAPEVERRSGRSTSPSTPRRSASRPGATSTTPQATAGEQLFYAAGCAGCHARRSAPAALDGVPRGLEPGHPSVHRPAAARHGRRAGRQPARTSRRRAASGARRRSGASAWCRR